MSTTRILDVLKTNWTGSRRLAFACALLIAITAAPLRSQTYQDLYDFNCNTGGCNPFDSGQLTQGADGNLYGTTQGSPNGYGTIFMVTPAGTYTDLWQFDGTNGANPDAGLTLASDGKFYGTTTSGGEGYGTVFRFTTPASFTVLHVFNNTDGTNPESAPVEAKDGNLYGATYSGTTYRIILPSGTFEQLPNNTPGFTFDPLLLASDGNLYGTTFNGGAFGPGTVFRMTTAGAIQVIYSFSGTGSDGAYPDGPLTQASDGNLYGTTSEGGANNSGMVFKLTLSGNFTVLHSFDAYSGSLLNNDGGGPVAGLDAASDGNLYGANSLGGANGNGTLFLTTTGGSFTKFFDFPGSQDAGPSPCATLMQHTNGILYGVTYGGFNSTGTGNFYSLTPATQIPILMIEGPVWLKPGVPVEILGDNLKEVSSITFAGVQAQFQPGSDTYLKAQVPSAAIDGLITATLVTGQQIESRGAVHILPVIKNLDPTSGRVGTEVGIVGGGFVGAKRVTFGGVKATRFTVVTPNLIEVIVPAGAKTGRVTVITHNGTATSKQTFTVQ